MAKKNRNNYFEMMVKQVEFCVEAAELLEKSMCNFSYDSISSLRREMHEIENKADELHHDILTKLSAEFITPIDQEDILRLVQIIDDITDALDEVILEIYMYDLRKLPDGTGEFSKLVKDCVKALLKVVVELKNFKKPEKIREYLVEVNTIEGKADEAYTEAIRHIFSNNVDAKILISSKAIFESLENCCDLCEHASDIVEQTIIKNT